MKINEIIKELRLAKKLTQEQMAAYLGVTAPAVNKWEKGTSYPDITLLPALARLLDTDLNTLLSFRDDMTEKEIGLFLNRLSEIFDKDGFDKAYDTATEKLKEYPTCHLLTLSTAVFLDGALIQSESVEIDCEKYRYLIESLYWRALCSPDESVKNRARFFLISKYIDRKEYEKAQELLEELPDKSPTDKKQLQAKLFIARGELTEAAGIEEEKLLAAANEIQTVLMTLMEIALKEHRMEDAEFIADVSKKAAKLFDLWEYNSYIAPFQLYTAQKDREKSMQTLIPMLKALTEKWEINQSPLYRHVKTKEINTQFGTKMQKTLIESIYEDEQTAFLRDNTELQAFLKQIEFEG